MTDSNTKDGDRVKGSQSRWHFSLPKIGSSFHKSTNVSSPSASTSQESSTSADLSPSQKIAESFSTLNVKDDSLIEQESILAELKEISKFISDFSDRVLDGIPSEYLEAEIDTHLVDAVQDVFLVSTASFMQSKGKNYGQFLHLALASSCFTNIFNTALKPFKFGVAAPKLAIIDEIYKHFRMNETQQNSFLWRKLTYKSIALLNDSVEEFNGAAAKSAARPLVDSIEYLLTGAFEDVEFDVLQFEDDLEHMCLLALNWKRRISTTESLIFDYEAITIPLDEDFASDEAMERVLTAKGSIFGGFGFGLRKIQYVEVEKGKFERVTQVVEWPDLVWENDS